MWNRREQTVKRQERGEYQQQASSREGHSARGECLDLILGGICVEFRIVASESDTCILGDEKMKEGIQEVG